MMVRERLKQLKETDPEIYEVVRAEIRRQH